MKQKTTVKKSKYHPHLELPDPISVKIGGGAKKGSKTPPPSKIGGGSKGWRPKGKVVVKDKLHGVSHEIIETKGDSSEEENPLNRKAFADGVKDGINEKITAGKTKNDIQKQILQQRAEFAEKLLKKKNEEIETLKNGQLLPADKAAPMDVQKMKEQIIELQEKLQPYKYEFTIGGSLVSVMVRPRAREVIPL